MLYMNPGRIAFGVACILTPIHLLLLIRDSERNKYAEEERIDQLLTEFQLKKRSSDDFFKANHKRVHKDMAKGITLIALFFDFFAGFIYLLISSNALDSTHIVTYQVSIVTFILMLGTNYFVIKYQYKGYGIRGGSEK